MDDRPLVLIVDDSSVNLMLLTGILKKEGFRTLQSRGGAEARKIALENPVDLILLDILMPEENGFETCQKLKEDPKTSPIPVIFISALEDVENKVKGLTIGGVDYISKPFEREEVLARTRLHIKLNRAYQTIIREQREKLLLVKRAQENLLVKPEEIPDAQFKILYQPIQEAGGDYYDVLELGQGIFGFFLGDISGHDVGTSLATSALKVALRQNSGPLYTPAETIRILNDLIKPIFEEGRYLTANYVQLNRNKSLITYLSAGHPAGLLVPKTGDLQVLESTGDVLGIFSSIHVDMRERSVSTGDRFFLFSDGLIEGFKKKKVQRAEGTARLMELLEQTRNQTLDQVMETVKVQFFPQGELPEDDMVFLGVEV